MLSLTAGTVHSYWMNNELFTKELGAWKNKSCIANLLNLLTIKETFTSSNGERVVSEWADLCTKRPRLCKVSFQVIEMPNNIGQKNGLVSGTTAGSSARVETTLCDDHNPTLLWGPPAQALCEHSVTEAHVWILDGFFLSSRPRLHWLWSQSAKKTPLMRSELKWGVSESQS